MITDKFVRVIERPWCGDLGFYLGERLPSGKTGVGTRVEMEEIEEGALLPPDPTFSLSQEAVQRLAQDLWDRGIRPKQMDGSQGEIRALRAHLDDIKAVMDKTLPLALRKS